MDWNLFWTWVSQVAIAAGIVLVAVPLFALSFSLAKTLLLASKATSSESIFKSGPDQ